MVEPDLKVRCQAKAKGTGVQCAHYPMHGQRVCHIHGGKSPQALAKAEDRLRALEFPAIATLEHIITDGDTDQVRLAAARWLLELLGHRATVEVRGEHELVIRVIDEPQPITIEQQIHRLNGYPNGRTDG